MVFMCSCAMREPARQQLCWPEAHASFVPCTPYEQHNMFTSIRLVLARRRLLLVCLCWWRGRTWGAPQTALQQDKKQQRSGNTHPHTKSTPDEPPTAAVISDQHSAQQQLAGCFACSRKHAGCLRATCQYIPCAPKSSCLPRHTQGVARLLLAMHHSWMGRHTARPKGWWWKRPAQTTQLVSNWRQLQCHRYLGRTGPLVVVCWGAQVIWHLAQIWQLFLSVCCVASRQTSSTPVLAG